MSPYHVPSKVPDFGMRRKYTSKYMCWMALSAIEEYKAGDGDGERQVGVAGLFPTERSGEHSPTEVPF